MKQSNYADKIDVSSALTQSIESLKGGNSGGVCHIPNLTDEAGTGDLDLTAYKPRILAVAGKNDFVILPEHLRQETMDVLEVQKHIGLETLPYQNTLFVDYDKSDETFSSAVRRQAKEIKKRMPDHIRKSWLMQPFIASQNMDETSEEFEMYTPRNTLSSEKINDKATAQSELRELGVLVPDGKLVHSLDEFTQFFEYLDTKGYKDKTFKLRRAVSGMGVFKMQDISQLEGVCKQAIENTGATYDPAKQAEYLDAIFTEGVLLDGWIQEKFISSPNIQYSIGKTAKDDRFIACSDQILGNQGTTHLGNVSDLSILKNTKLQADLASIRDWIRSKGAYGVVGIDFSIHVDESGKTKAYFMEINGRINGSTHGPNLADIAGMDPEKHTWAVSNNVAVAQTSTVHDIVSLLESDKLLYNPDTKTGVIPTNFATISSGKLMLEIIDTRDKINETLNHLTRSLGY